MSDLVKRLTNFANDCRGSMWQSRDETIRLMDAAADRIKELEAKLAKAVEDLERIGSGEFSGRMLTSMPPQDAAAYFARSTLAEQAYMRTNNWRYDLSGLKRAHVDLFRFWDDDYYWECEDA